jgi:D-alanine-D-alanine ligase
VDFSGLDPDLPPILTYASKVQPQSRQWKQVRLRPAELSDEGRELHGYCRTVFERLGCRDYARFDFRCGLDGTPRLIDVNCHPMWGEGGMMATMAGFAGLGYAQMLERIIRAGAQRLRGRGAPGEAFAHAVPA